MTPIQMIRAKWRSFLEVNEARLGFAGLVRDPKPFTSPRQLHSDDCIRDYRSRSGASIGGSASFPRNPRHVWVAPPGIRPQTTRVAILRLKFDWGNAWISQIRHALTLGSRVER